MPRAKQSPSDRIVAEVLALPHQEATWLVSFLATTLKQLTPTSRGLSKAPSVPKPVVVASPVVLTASPTRRPRKVTPAPTVGEVPAGDPAIMDVGD